MDGWDIKQFSIVLPPRGQARPRHARITKKDGSTFDLTYKTKEQKTDEKKLEALMFEHRPDRPFQGELLLGVRAYLEVPKSRPKKFREAALAGDIRPTGKPDLDNILKHLKDVGTGIFWGDDRQVVGYIGATGKYYAEVPHYEVVIGFKPELQ